MTDRIHCSYGMSEPMVWRLERDYTRQTSIGPVTVPTGFAWDGASVPQALTNILPRWGMYSGAALVHDWLYARHENCGVAVTKEEADQIFRDLMVEDGVRPLEAMAMFAAVKAFGEAPWVARAESDAVRRARASAP